MIKEERANQIEMRPDEVIDGESFRIAHAYGRWNGVIFTAITIVGGAGAYSMMQNSPGAGKRLLQTHSLFTVPAAIGMYYVYY